MSPLARSSLAALRADLDAELRKVDEVVREAARLRREIGDARPSTTQIAAAAAHLHAFYTGIEKALQRIARVVDGSLPEGPAWHRDLLQRMTLEVAAVRPALLPAEAARLLARYLDFRHVFRNLYFFDLDWAPLAALLDDIGRAWAPVRPAIDRLLEFLAATLPE